MNAHVGFVVIGRNEGARLVRCLDAIQSEARSIVYVDSGSTDGSVEMAEARGINVVRLDTKVPFTAGRARNEGFTALRHAVPDVAFVQFIDGDCELDENWVDTAKDFLIDNTQVAVVCGRRRERFPDASIYNRLCDREWDTPIGEAAACGGDALFRSAALEGVGGYTPALIAGEEPELCSRMRTAGWKIWRLDTPMTLHDAAMLKWGQWWTRGVRSGFGYAQVNVATRSLPQPLYRNEIRRAWLWAFSVPVTVLVFAVLVSPFACTLLLVYPIQAARVALRAGGRDRWAYGALMVVSKFPELKGIMRYRVRQGRRNDAIVYK